MRDLFIDTLYKRIWRAAEVLSELEARQFDEKPYSERVITIGENGYPALKYDDITRRQFKDRHRWGHINNMMQMYEGLMETAEEAETENEKERLSDNVRRNTV